MSSFLPVGKLPAAKLNALLQRLPQRDPRVVLGPRLGEDAAVLDLNDRYLVVASDPVTFASDRIGWYVVHVNANDVAVLGAAIEGTALLAREKHAALATGPDS